MAGPQYFDYEKSASEAGLTADQLRQIERIFRADYPADDTLYELHVLRACHAIRDGMTTFEAMLRASENGESAAAQSTNLEAVLREMRSEDSAA